MASRWLLLILLLTTACGKPIPRVPLKEIQKEEKPQQDKSITAPPPAYGNKIV